MDEKRKSSDHIKDMDNWRKDIHEFGPIEDEFMNRVGEITSNLVREGKYFQAADVILGLVDLEGNPTGRIFDFFTEKTINPDGTVWKGWDEDTELGESIKSGEGGNTEYFDFTQPDWRKFIQDEREESDGRIDL